MYQKVLFLLISLYPVTVLAQQEEGASSPEDLVKRYVQAMRSGDQKTLEALIPDIGLLHQKVNHFAQLLDEKMKLEKDWKLELKKRFAEKDKDGDRFAPPNIVPQPAKASELVKAIPQFTVTSVVKETVSPDLVKLTIESTDHDKADKNIAHWQANKINGKWILSLPTMKQAAQLYEKSMLTFAGTKETHRAMQQAIDDLKQNKFTKVEDAETAWNKATQLTTKTEPDGTKEYPEPGRKPPGPGK
jgi:hypothetical protein